MDHRSVREARREAHIVQRRGQDPPAYREDARRFRDRGLHAAGDLGHGGNEQVAERVAGHAHAGAVVEAVLEELRDQGLGIGERGDAVADVAGGDDVQVATQPTARSAVVGDGDDRREVGRVLLQAAQQVRQTGAAAEGDDARASVTRAVLVDEVHEVALAVAVGQQRVRERSVELPPGEDRERERRRDEQQSAQPARDELQGDVVGPHRERVGDVGLAEDVCEADAHDGDGDAEEEQPSLDVQPDVQPFGYVAAAQRITRSLPATSSKRSRALTVN